MYPILLKLRGVPVLVIGGGKVAERKARRLTGEGATVTLVSPDATEPLKRLVADGAIRWIRRDFLADDVRAVRLAFAATDSRETNAAVAESARRAGVWATVADSAAASDFHVPATVQRGGLTLTVSTGGASPALSRRIREELEARYGPEYEPFMDLLARARLQATAKVPTQATRHRLYEAILDSNALELLKRGDADGARRVADELAEAADE